MDSDGNSRKYSGWQWTFAICVIAMVAGLLIGLFGAAQSHSGHGVEGNLIFDFGEVRSGSVIQHRFSIWNDGDGSIRVMEAQSTCGCTVADVVQREIAPGSSVPMLVELKTAGKSGEVVQPVVVALSDGTVRTYEMRGFVVNYELEPIRFDTVLRGETPQKSATLTWAPGVELEVQRVLFDENKLRVSVESGEGHHQFKIAISPQAPYGPIGENIRVRTNDPVVPDKVIQVFGMVAYPVVCEPDQITLGVVELGKVSEGALRVKSPYSLPLSVSRISLDSGVPVTWTENRIDDSEIEVRVQLRPERQQSYYKSVVRILVRAEDWGKEFEVEVYGVGVGVGEMGGGGDSHLYQSY